MATGSAVRTKYIGPCRSNCGANTVVLPHLLRMLITGKGFLCAAMNGKRKPLTKKDSQ